MASAYLLLAACLASVAASAPTSPQQARMTLHPDASKRVVTWVSLEPAATSTVVQFGPAATFPAGATTSSSGRFRTYPIVTCPSNSSRSVHSATIDAPPGVATSWRGSSDGGVTWGDTYTFTAPADVNAYPLREALWGDMATYNAGNSAGQILRDVLRGDAQLLTHFGDTAYDMYDSCGAVGDAYLNDPAVTAYSTQAPLGVIYTPGNHESLHSGEDYSEFIYRLGDAQNELAAACGSGNNRYIAWRTGRVMHVSVDADAWIYPPVWSLAKPQYEWLEAFLPTVNRTETPWLVFYSHRALYCTKTTDGECNSEAETLRYGFFGVEYGLEALLHKFGVDFAFAGHTHHFETTWPVYKNASTAHSYDAPGATVYVQSGIAGTGPGGDPFDVPQMEWESYRDTSFTPSYSHLTFVDDETARFEQRRASDGTVIFAFNVTHARHSFAQ